MTAQVSDRVRTAMERLDQAIDRLDGTAGRAAAGSKAKSSGKAVADRLDRMIERIESALAG